MKKVLITLITFLTLTAYSQNPGLVISEVLANPNGTDSCKEYVELVATRNINFAQTPYSIIVCNNGVATTAGWLAGGGLTYGFEVTSGQVSTGDVVYVGGSCMTPPASAQVRVLNVKYVNGDGGLGNAAAAGVFGNGGSNVDGVAVFSGLISSLTNSSVPKDALFYGTGIGTASVNAGIDGYQLPANDLYAGGKLNSSSFFTIDPATDVIITAIGLFNTTTNTWSTPRTFSSSTLYTALSSVSLTSNSTGLVTLTFLSNDSTALESSSLATMYLRLSATSTSSAAISVSASVLSNAAASDYTLSTTVVTVAANTPSNTTFPINILINNDAIIESSEYVVLRLFNPVNATIGSTNQCNFYLQDNDKPIPAATNALTLNLLSSFSNSIAGANSAEIVAHDPTTQRLYIANSVGGKLDIVNFINPSSPSLLASISVTPYGNINSVAVKNGTVACAIENITNPQDSGSIVFFNKDGVFLKQVKAGMMPDMITFNHSGTRVLTANEGEPNQNYSVTAVNDPDGSITIVDISGGLAALTQTNVTHVTFTAYNGQENTLRAQGIRIYGPWNMASKDFEPEYISVAKDDSKAWVTLQENNAIVEISMSTYSINYIKALGSKDHSLLNNGLDGTNQTKGVNIANFPIKGFYLPDAIASYTVGGVNYLITANEGDSRAYATFTEERRLSTATLDAVKFPNAAEIKNNYFLGRLNITDKNGDTDNDGDLDTIYSYGARSFSIWNANTGNLVYDSKDDLEQITASGSFSLIFNASNSIGAPVKKDRSDDKGPEPEGVTIGAIGTNTYAFIACERIGGVMVYDVTNPNTPVFVTYANNRSTSTSGPDLGAEGIIFIPQSESPNGQHLVIAANEISSSLSIWGIPGCQNPIPTLVSMSGNSVLCSNQPPIISVPPSFGNYQWYNGTTPVSGATSNTFSPLASGNYSVKITNGPNCFANSLTKSVTIVSSPSLVISTTGSVICVGDAATLTATGANNGYTWTPGGTGSMIVVNPSVTTTYTLNGENNNGCASTALFSQSVSICTSLGELASNFPTIIYPNPAQSHIRIRYNPTISTDVRIFNTIGELVLTVNNYSSEDLIEIADLARGVYFVSVKQQTTEANIQKLIIH